MGISGQSEGLPQVPDGVFLPPMPMSCVEEHVRGAVHRAYGGTRRMTIGRTAVLTRDHLGRRACHYCGPCHRGCRTRSYFSSVNATLPAAHATGRLTLRPNSVVPGVVWDARRGRVTGVRVIDRETREELEFHARVVFLGASALESTRILLNSTSADFPDGLANSSGALGKYLMDHTMCVDTRATFDGWDDRTTRGRRPNGIYIARFANVTEPSPDFERGYGFQGAAETRGLGTRRVHTGLRRRLQARADPSGALGVPDARLRRVSPARGEPRGPRSRAGRRLGHPHAPHPLRMERQ